MKLAKVVAVVFLISGAGLFATPTGINNIPTADVVPDRKVAIQSFGSFGQGSNQFAANGAGKSSLWMGFKAGIQATAPVRVEIGIDSPVAPTKAGPLVFQTKANFSPWENGLIALGIANIALTDFDRAGRPFSYGIVAQDFGLLRAHAGYGFQLNSNTALFGVDRNLRVLGRSLNLNIDLVQSADHSYWLPAAGFKFDPTQYIVLESWANFPGRGRSSYIAKINFVFGV
ncbi:MAG: hypothetical protein HQ462_11350 [Deltaproteobacteria bacterium]|nr:hypothetical protein [Deltaproteobacteria bacterium]